MISLEKRIYLLLYDICVKMYVKLPNVKFAYHFASVSNLFKYYSRIIKILKICEIEIWWECQG